jgi:regulatory protein
LPVSSSACQLVGFDYHSTGGDTSAPEVSMPEITGVRERRNRARVFVDGEFWAELDAAVAVERGLREGTAFSQEELDRVRVAGERPVAMGRALNLLGYRARSESEIRDRLRRYGYVGETIEGVVLRLKELGYLDDAEFARTKAREKARRYGPRRVSVELRKSGVGETLAREVVEEEFAGRSELGEARSAAARRYNERGSDAEARRVYGFLVRRGYSAEVCAQVAREYREPPKAKG